MPEGAQNTYIEYMYVNNAWEKVGEYKAEIDLSDYAKTADVYTKDNPGEILDDVVNGLEDGSLQFTTMDAYLGGKYVEGAAAGQTFVDKINEMNGSYVNTEIARCVKSADIEYMTDEDVTSALATLFPAE